VGVLRGLLAVEDRRPGVLQHDLSRRSELTALKFAFL
jgi:hypothetical protein